MVIICAVCQIDVPCKEYLCGWFFWENSEFIELKYIKSTADLCPVLYKSVKNWAHHKACKKAILIKICPNVLKIMKTTVLCALWWAQFLMDLYKTGHQSTVFFMYFNSVYLEFSQKKSSTEIFFAGDINLTHSTIITIYGTYTALSKNLIYPKFHVQNLPREILYWFELKQCEKPTASY